MRAWARWTGALVCGAVSLTGCGDDGGEGAEPDPDRTTTTAAAETLDILVTNDDGIEGEGLAVLVDVLQELPDTGVTVVVPDENRTGTGGRTTPGGVTAAEATTVNGDEALAVSGFPADSVIYALDEVFTDEAPDLVVSGINAGQNVGPVVEGSGTVGAARQAAALGVPALAVSQGLIDEFDYTTAVEQALAWIEQHRDEVLADETAEGEQTEAQSINVPSCTAGAVRELVEVPIAENADPSTAVAAQDCTSTLENPADDVEALNNGFITLSVLPPGLSELQ